MAQNIPFTPWQPQHPFDNLPTTARTVRTVSKSRGAKEYRHGSSTIVASDGRTCKPSKRDTTLMGRTLNVLPNKGPPQRRAKEMLVQGLQECLAYGQQPLGTALVQPVYKFNGVDGYQLYAYTTVHYLNGAWQPWLICKPNKEDIAFMTRGLNTWDRAYNLQAAPGHAAGFMDNSEAVGLGGAQDHIIVPVRQVQAHLKAGHGQHLESPRFDDSTTTDEPSGRNQSLLCTPSAFNGARLIRGPVRRTLDNVDDLRDDSAVADDLGNDSDSDATTKIAYEEPRKLSEDLTSDRMQNGPKYRAATMPPVMEDEDCGDSDSNATARPAQEGKLSERRVQLSNDSSSASDTGEEDDFESEEEDYDDDGYYRVDESTSDNTPPHEFSYEELLPYRNTGWLHVAPYLRYPDYELQSEIRNVRGRLLESSIRGPGR